MSILPDCSAGSVVVALDHRRCPTAASGLEVVVQLAGVVIVCARRVRRGSFLIESLVLRTYSKPIEYLPELVVLVFNCGFCGQQPKG